MDNMMHDQDLPTLLWAKDTRTVVYIQNGSPHSILGEKTPEEVFLGKKPDVGHLRIFGCPVFIYVPKEKRTKMEPSDKKGIFVGVVVASFTGSFPSRITELPLDRHFDINNVKEIMLEADGYQPYRISPEKGSRALIKGVLELVKESACVRVDEVHRVLIDIVSTVVSATPGLRRYLPFKREIVAIASSALDDFRVEAKKWWFPLLTWNGPLSSPQHLIRLV